MGRAALAAIIGCFILSSPALAQGIFHTPDQEPAAWDDAREPEEWDVNLAVGAAMQPTFHGSDRYRATPIPLVIIRWRDMVSLGADGLSLYWHDNNLRIGGGVSYDGGRLDHETNGFLSGGDDRLRGLGDIDSAVGLRGFVSYKLGPAYLDSAVTKYVGSGNNGTVLNFGASAPLMLGKHFVLRPHIGARWADDNYMQTFFGISPLQAARSQFPQFNAGAGLEDINGGLTVGYLLNKHWFLGADASATRYLDRAAKSPITIADTNATVAAVVGYHF